MQDDKEQTLIWIGKEVRRYRTLKGMSLFDLEALTDISKKQLLKIEQGKVDFRLITLLKIADALDIEAWKIYKG